MLGRFRCGRLLYAGILVAVVAFDLAKTPIERFLIQAHDRVLDTEADVKDKTAAELAEAGYIVTKQGEFLAPQNGKIMKHPAGGTAGRSAGMPRPEPQPVMTQTEFIASVAAHTGKRVVVGAGYVGAVWAVGIASLLAVAWAIFARLRDIGWSHRVGLGIIAILIVRLWALPYIPPSLSVGMQSAFLLCVLGLAFVPGGFAARHERAAALPGRKGASSTSKPRPLFGATGKKRPHR